MTSEHQGPSIRESTPDQITALLTVFAATLPSARTTTAAPEVILEQVLDLLADLRAILPRRSSQPVVDPSQIGPFMDVFKDVHQQWAAELACENPSLNIWDSLALGRDEVKNCRVLAWLLDPHADHMQGSRLLRCLLRVVDHADFSETLADETYYAYREEWMGGGERIDIMLAGPTFCLLIEAKIDAGLRRDQLDRYWARIANRYAGRRLLGWYLTTDEKPPEGGQHAFRALGWGKVAAALMVYAGSSQSISDSDRYVARNPFIQELARQYASFIKTHVES